MNSVFILSPEAFQILRCVSLQQRSVDKEQLPGRTQSSTSPGLWDLNQKSSHEVPQVCASQTRCLPSKRHSPFLRAACPKHIAAPCETVKHVGKQSYLVLLLSFLLGGLCSLQCIAETNLEYIRIAYIGKNSKTRRFKLLCCTQH